MVVIEVRGGLVAEVYTDDPDLAVVLIDWDTEGSQGDSCTFVVSDADGHEYVALAADYPTTPLDQMPHETREAVALATTGHQV